MRIFIAINIPDNIRDSLSSVQDELQSSITGVNWVKKDNLHVTLKFIGEIADRRLEDISDISRSVCTDEVPIRLSLGSVGAFSSFKRPRVIWVGIEEGLSEVTRLAGKIENALEEIFISKSGHLFRAHVTIGRVKKGEEKEAVEVGPLVWEPPSSWEADSISIVKSVLSPNGPAYTVLTKIALGC